MATDNKSKYWLDLVVDQIEAAHPTGELIIESGHSPSGNYHIGFLREFLISSAIAEALRRRGRAAKHLDFVDDFDLFRKVPANLSAEWQQYIGQPLYLVPDPFGDCHQSYADHFLLQELYDALERLGTQFESRRASIEYPKGFFTTSIEQSLEQLPKVKEIIARVSQRQLDDDWSPVQILSDDHNLRDWVYTGWDKARQVVMYRAQDGSTGEVSYTDGRVKLDWRLDWPARWALLNVSAEPFGRDHASKGGSYDSGSVLVQDIFGGQPPLAVPYEFVNLVGQTKKMSKSAGNVMTPGDALEVMPPEIIRYFLGKSRPAKTLFFDPGVGLYNLIDEYSKVESEVAAGQPNEYAEAYEFASLVKGKRTISSVRFSHLVAIYQTARGDHDKIWELLERTGYGDTIKAEREVIEAELKFVKSWLDKYAPAEVKFAVQDELPQVELTKEQKDFLTKLSEAVATMKEPEAQAMHDAIYAAKGDMSPAEAFQTLYRLILGQDKGPRAGWFLASLDQDWLQKRLRLEA
jgi:lysyl-tRNA synthetase, class I